jgi:hypothetical protein
MQRNQNQRRVNPVSQRIHKLPKAARPATNGNGHHAPAAEQPEMHPINPHSTAIIQQMIADEEQKRQAYEAARMARAGVVESTAAAMGLNGVQLTAHEGTLVFVGVPAQPLPEGMELVENMGD